jgi:MurNAc alpha-1-phosphate uridylyltransferase
MSGPAPIRTAMLMAAGLGTRMRPLTEHLPKPLIPVGGRAMIDHLLDALIAAGVTHAVVNVHWLADLMEAHLRRRTDIAITFSDERDQLLETGGGLVKALPLLGRGPVYVLNTDAFWWPVTPGPLLALAQAFDPQLMDECLLLARPERSLGYDGAGDFNRDAEGRLTRRGSAPSAPFAFAGARVCDLARYRQREATPFSANRVWDESLAAGRLHGVVMDPAAFWLHVGDPEALAQARRHVGDVQGP